MQWKLNLVPLASKSEDTSSGPRRDGTSQYVGMAGGCRSRTPYHDFSRVLPGGAVVKRDGLFARADRGTFQVSFHTSLRVAVSTSHLLVVCF